MSPLSQVCQTESVIVLLSRRKQGARELYPLKKMTWTLQHKDPCQDENPSCGRSRSLQKQNGRILPADERQTAGPVWSVDFVGGKSPAVFPRGEMFMLWSLARFESQLCHLPAM